MRIISGSLRGKKINPPKNLEIRPTTDRVKESVFNILMNTHDFTEMSVLDLFSGSGNMSYEFASRGCQFIKSVDIDRKACKFIEGFSKQNLNTAIEVVNADSIKYINSTYEKFDLIFADPPYDYEDYRKLISTVFERDLLNDKGFLLVEHNKFTKLDDFEEFYKSRKYGGTILSFYQKP